ncbi:MAG: AAA family ATPase [Anaerolineales bacterium]|nr:AAA family ATPase [Anaerolineales bacterium]
MTKPHFFTTKRPLRVLLLGPPEVYWQDSLLQINRRILRAMLYYLASQGKPVPRARVMQLFDLSPDDPNDRQRMRERLSRLRAALPQSDLVQSDSETIGLNFERVWVDQLAFEAMFPAAQKLGNPDPSENFLPAALHVQISDAITLWRGPNFLAGEDLPNSLAFDRWLQETSQHIETNYCQALAHLVWHEIAARNFPTAIALARQGLENDRLNENLLIAVMYILVRLGQPAEAQQHYHACRDLFQAELGLPPPVRMSDLLEQIQSGTDPGRETHNPIPFVARQKELAEIRSAFQKRQGAFILGMAGQGKTRLIEEYLWQLDPATRLIFAKNSILDRNLPYQALRDALQQSVQPEEWQALPLSWAQQLSTLIPEILAHRPDSLPVSRPAKDWPNETILLEAIRQVFLLLASRAALVLVMDDLQWADEATMLALSFLLQRAPFNQQACLIAAARSEELVAPLSDLIIAARTGRYGQVITLDPLQLADITILANHILDDPASPKFLDELTALSAGNPLFTIEILQTFRDTKTPAETLQGLQMPPTTSLRRLLHNRLDSLDGIQLQTLAAAAVIGTEFDTGILAQACQLEHSHLLWILDQLASALLLVVDHGSSGRQYRFRHDRIREVVLETLTAAQRQQLHRRVAQAWKTSSRPPAAGILAAHYESGGAVLEAYRYWVQAGKQADQAFALQDAGRAFAQAKGLLEQVKYHLSEAEIVDLYSNWSLVAYETNGAALIRTLGQDLIDLGRERQSNFLIGLGFDVLSDSCLALNQFGQGLEYSDQAIYYLEQGNHPFELSEAYAHRGVFKYMLNDLLASIEDLKQALAFRNQLQARRVFRTNPHFQLALLHTLRAQPRHGLRHALLGLQEDYASQRLNQAPFSQGIAITACIYLGKYRPALRYAKASLDLARRTQAIRMLAYILGGAAMVELKLGKLDDAYQRAEEAIQIGKGTHQQDLVALGCCQLGEVFRLLGDLPQAHAYYQSGFEAIPQHFMGLDNAFRLGLVNVVTGQTELGLQQIQVTRAVFRQAAVTTGEVMAGLSECAALLFSDPSKDLEQSIQELIAQTARQELRHHHCIAVYLLGEAAWQVGQLQTAKEQLQTAQQLAQRLMNPWHELAALTRLEQIDQQLGIDNPEIATRIEVILETIARETRSPALQAAFQQFQQRVRARTHLTTYNF